MISVPTQCDVCEASVRLEFLVRQGKRLGLLRFCGLGFSDYDRQNDCLEDLRDELTGTGGQYLSFDLSSFMERGVAETLLSEAI